MKSFTKTLATTVFTAIFAATAMAQSAGNPIVGTGTTLDITKDGTATVADNGITLNGSSSFSGATVAINNFAAGDALSYTGTLPSGVTASYNSTTGILTFSGAATPAQYQALLRTVTYSTTVAAGSSKSLSFTVGSALSYNGHYYQYVSGSYTWTNAKAAAAAQTLYGMQGYLATITSQGENDFIQNKLQADGWMGASDQYQQVVTSGGSQIYSSQTQSEGKWYWVTGPEKGTQFSKNNDNPTAINGRYMNWNDGEPNNLNGEHYAEIYTTGNWNDLPNSYNLGYVVEFGGMSGDPSVTLTYTRTLNIVSATVTGTAANNVYGTSTGGRVTADRNITVTGGASVTNAKVTITPGFSYGDTLSYSAAALPSGVTGSYSVATGVLSFTGTATPAAWQSLLRTVAYSRSNTNTANRTITFYVANNTASFSRLLTSGLFTLGLNWVSFTATANGSNVNLQWATADEKNTAGFDVEHSTDGRSFTKIGEVKAGGSGSNTYDYTDMNAAEGINYYRLKQTDNDGTFQYSKVITANIRTAAAATVSLFPNPATDAIRISGVGSNATVELYAVNGARVLAQQINNNDAVSVTTLPAGCYAYRITDAGGAMTTGKLQIAH